MDPAAIRELIALESSQIDASFEYWLSASFAVVVAAYAARESLSRLARYILSGAYLIFTIGTLLKFWADVSEIVQLSELLIGTDFDARTVPNWLAAGARVFMYLFFSSIVTMFVFLSESIVSDEHPESG
jgi:hypothetical protein